MVYRPVKEKFYASWGAFEKMWRTLYLCPKPTASSARPPARPRYSCTSTRVLGGLGLRTFEFLPAILNLYEFLFGRNVHLCICSTAVCIKGTRLPFGCRLSNFPTHRQVCAINSSTSAAGAMLAVSCDHRIFVDTPRSTIGQPVALPLPR